MSGKKDVLSLINQKAEKKGSFRIGSTEYYDVGGYDKPVTIHRVGLPRKAEPPVVDTGTDPHLGNPGQPQLPRYVNGQLMRPGTGLVPPKSDEG